MAVNASELKSLLKDPSLVETRAYVNGEWIDADDRATFTVTNPARGTEIAQVADLSRTEVPVPLKRLTLRDANGPSAPQKSAPTSCVAGLN